MTQDLLNELEQFTGTEHYYAYWGGLKLTDGAKYLADKAQCYWLMDIIASYQPDLRKEEFQAWILYKKADNSAIVICDNGNGKVLFEQRIPFTDFPADSVKLYCTNGVILLPSEY